MCSVFGRMCSLRPPNVFSFPPNVFSGERERSEGREVRPERRGDWLGGLGGAGMWFDRLRAGSSGGAGMTGMCRLGRGNVSGFGADVSTFRPNVSSFRPNVSTLAREGLGEEGRGRGVGWEPLVRLIARGGLGWATRVGCSWVPPPSTSSGQASTGSGQAPRGRRDDEGWDRGAGRAPTRGAPTRTATVGGERRIDRIAQT